VGTRPESKRAKLASWLATRQPQSIDEALFAELREHLAPVSDSYLRQLLKHSGLPLAPMVEGVSLHGLDHLERTLLALECEYASADRPRRSLVRNVVIEAKNRLRWTIKRAGDPSAERAEMLLWVMTWLENPELFELWVKLRRLAPPGEGRGAS
jgi:hypothetical protein